MSSYPEVVINKYVWKQFEIAKPAIYSKYNVVPFFPVSDIKAGDAAWEKQTYVIYDSFMKNRSKYKSFYPIKMSQMMYGIRGQLEDIFIWRDFIINVLDREDVAAREINAFGGATFNDYNTNFHSIRCHQMNYINNTTEQSGARKYFTTNLVIQYDYHRTDLYNN